MKRGEFLPELKSELMTGVMLRKEDADVVLLCKNPKR